MVIQNIIFWLLDILFIYFSAKKYIKSRNTTYLFLDIIQVVNTIVLITAMILKLNISWYIQCYILILNYVVPSLIFWAECSGKDFDEFVSIKLGDFYARRENYMKAIECYKKALTKNSSNAETFAKIGKMYKFSGDRRTAFDRFAKAIEINRDDYKSYYEIGLIFNDMGKLNDASMVLDNALRIKPDFTPASELLGEVLMKEEKYDEAANVYQSATKYDPENYNLFYNMGIAKSELQKFEEADLCYRKAIEINPTMYNAYFNLGQIYLLKNELSKAEEMFKKSVPDSECMAKAYYQLAKINALRNDNEEAVNYIGYSIDIDPSFKEKALEDPIFINIKEYITGAAILTSKASKEDISFPEKSYKRVTKKVFNVEEDDEEPVANYTLDEEIPAQEDEEINLSQDEVSRAKSFDKKLKEMGYEVEEEKTSDDEEEIDEESEEEDDYYEEGEAPKQHKFLNFFKRVLGMDIDDDDEDEDFFKEDDVSSKVRVVQDEDEENDEDINFFTREEKAKQQDVTAKIDDEEDEKTDNYDFRAKETFKTSFDEDDLDIFEKFKKLKEEEDQKAVRLKNEEKLRMLEEEKAKSEPKSKKKVFDFEDDETENFNYLDRYKR